MVFSSITQFTGNKRKVSNATLANVHRRKQTVLAEMDVYHILLAIFAICFTLTDALMFHLAPNTKKCLREEIHKDVLVAGDYGISEAPGQKINLAVS